MTSVEDAGEITTFLLMNRAPDNSTTAKSTKVCESVIELLKSRNLKARFLTEVYAALARAEISAKEADHALAELEAQGRVLVRDHFCADPHLATVDLRVAALVDSAAGEDPQLNALQRIDDTWNKWLNEYLANHRCG